MYLLKVDFGTPEFDNILKLRNEILRVPLNLIFDTDDIALEWNQIHYGYYNDKDELVGCLTYQIKGHITYKMRQVAIKEQYRSKGFGHQMVLLSEELLKENGVKTIELNARDVAVKFYQKLAYKKEGEAFTEVNIKHFKMLKIL